MSGEFIKSVWNIARIYIDDFSKDQDKIILHFYKFNFILEVMQSVYMILVEAGEIQKIEDLLPEEKFKLWMAIKKNFPEIEKDKAIPICKCVWLLKSASLYE